MLILPATVRVISSFVAEPIRRGELSTIAGVMVAPRCRSCPSRAHGRLDHRQLALAATRASSMKARGPSRRLGRSRLHWPACWDEALPQMYEPAEPGPDEEVARSLFVDSFDGRVAQTIVEHLRASTAPLAVAQIRVLGGAMTRVSAHATAFTHRERGIMVALGAVYERPEETAMHEEWVGRFAAALRQGDGGVYVNFLGDEGEARIREAYPGATAERLAEIKAATTQQANTGSTRTSRLRPGASRTRCCIVSERLRSDVEQLDIRPSPCESKSSSSTAAEKGEPREESDRAGVRVAGLCTYPHPRVDSK